jgi:small subunit ribosomal protein S6
MRRYELMLLFRPDLEDDKLQSAVEKVTRAIVNAGGALTKVSPWGKRRLAYEIQHFREASYFLIHFDIAPSAVREIEQGLRISEEILRHLVIVLEERGPADDEPVEAVPARDERDGGEPPSEEATASDGEASDAEEPAEGAPEVAAQAAPEDAPEPEDAADDASDNAADEPQQVVEA